MGKYINPLDPPYVAPPVEPKANTPSETPAAAATASTSTIPTDSDIAALGDLINSLAPAELAKLRIIARQVAPEIAEAAGIDSNIRKLANGNIECRIVLSPDVVSMIEPWMESSGRTLGEEIQEVAEVSITSYLSTDWQSIKPVVTGEK